MEDLPVNKKLIGQWAEAGLEGGISCREREFWGRDRHRKRIGPKDPKEDRCMESEQRYPAMWENLV